jgi:hypothetical protein
MNSLGGFLFYFFLVFKTIIQLFNERSTPSVFLIKNDFFVNIYKNILESIDFKTCIYRRLQNAERVFIGFIIKVMLYFIGLQKAIF